MCMTREAHTLALSLELGTPVQQAGRPSPQPARRPPASPPGRAAKLPAASKTYCSACQEMAAAAQAGERPEPGKAEGWGGLGDLPTQTPLHGGPACLGRPGTDTPTRLFPTCPLRTGFPVGVHATVRRAGGPARPPPEKDLWSLVSQLTAWKQCQVAECF